MRELKNKELIAGLVILILLSITAMILIVKKEMKQPEEKKTLASESIIEVSESEQESETMNLGTTETKTDISKTKDSAETKTSKTKDSSEIETGSVFTQSGEKYVSASMIYYKDDDQQLTELYSYWDQYQLDAVSDLINLKRIKNISNELKGTNSYYYYGDVDKNGKPSGKGLAVYANNAYYCGEWKNGLRSGEGMWLQIYPDKPVALNGVKGVIEHSYNGMWLDDYPNGTGQEHIEYDLSIIDKNDAYNNVIGSFKDGYYDGELYIMTMDKDGHTIDWSSDAKKGTYLKLKDVAVSQMGKEAVWEKNEEDGLDESDFYWLFPSVNGNFGIYGLKK